MFFTLSFFLAGREWFVPFFVAAIFGVHPMHVESVAWISERKDLLYSFFFLSGLISLDLTLQECRQRKAAGHIYGIHLQSVLFILSCLSKAMAVSFPSFFF
ncbi:MAG: hypothetical protein MZU84_00410 [Sphingobacterium sp.]|nr:hypothetical protein [Sphingobacterium sp.]